MNRALFFNVVREEFGPLVQPQVTGFSLLLDEAERRKTRLNDLANIFGTAWHETGFTMRPVDEKGPVSYFKKYEPGTPIGKVLGNTQPGDGHKFRGRSWPQLTGRRNYEFASKRLGVDFIKYPSLVSKPEYGIPIMFDGMAQGWFTGKKLSDYIDGVDEPDSEDLREFIQARRVINGTDKAEAIGRYCLKFEKALRAAKYGETTLPPPDIEKPVPEPPQGWIAAFLDLILTIFKTLFGKKE